MSLSQCGVCLNKSEFIASIGETDTKGVKWSFKLEKAVPEVEWLEFYKICDHCKDQLETTYEFRNTCLMLDEDRRELKLGFLNKLNKFERLDWDFNNISSEDEDKLNGEQETVEQGTSEIGISVNEDKELDQDLKCSYCNKSFTSKTDLTKHFCKKNIESKITKISTSANCKKIRKKKFEYNKCIKRYSQAELLKNHETLCDGFKECKHKVDGETDYQCGNCKNYYNTSKILHAHFKRCTGKVPSKNTGSEVDGDNLAITSSELSVKSQKGRLTTRSFSCEVCNEVFIYAKLVVEHCVAEHSMDFKEVKPYTCNECPMRFSSSANLIQHKKYHEGSRTHICSFCGKTYITKSDLTVHEYTHYNRRNYKCEECGKAFNTNKNLRSHILVVHTDSSLWKYACTMCEKRFPLKSGFDQHIRRHTGDKRFPCHICQKPFVSRSELQKHINFHSNVRAFKCDHCEKEYKERKIYEIHLTKVHGIGDAKIPLRAKKFVCHMCPNAFSDRQKLTRHLCSHTGVKPFSCDHCDKNFTDKSYLKHHLKIVHSIYDTSIFS